MNWFYAPETDAETTAYVLEEDESKHVSRVLRYQNGDSLALVNGKGVLLECEIVDNHPKRCAVYVKKVRQEPASTNEIHIAIAPTKNNERLEWFLEKTCELGITEISLIVSKNSERKQSKEERLEKILVSAMKQSKRLFLPKLNPLTDLNSFVKKHPTGAVAHCYEGQKSKLEHIFECKSFPILIGPEGDFTKEEVELLTKSGYKSITLGKNRLRTETAGLFACMLALTQIGYE